MGVRTGFWGDDVFGQGFFGWPSTGLPLSGSVISQTLIDALTQEIPNSQIIGGRVLVNDVDVSALVESISIRLSDSAATGAAEITFIGDVSATIATGASLKIYFDFVFENGGTYGQRIFTGVVKAVVPALGSSSESTQVMAWDATEAALSVPPHNTTWTGTAKALIQDELSEAGIDYASLDFADYSMTSQDLSNFTTVRDLVASVADGIDECGIFTQGNGRVCVWSYSAARMSPTSTAKYRIPRTGYTYLQPVNSLTYRHKVYTVTGTTGTMATATGTGTNDSGESSLFRSVAADLQDRADAVVAKAERTSVNLQVPLNPVVRVGDLIAVERAASVYANYRVTDITHTIEWTGESSPGAWSTIGGEAVA